MALIKCPDCGKKFSEYAECCPECGCPTEDAKAANKEDDSPISQNIEETESDKQPSSNVANNREDESVLQEKIQLSMGENPIRKWLWSVGIIAIIVIGFIIAYLAYGSRKSDKGSTTETGIIQAQVEQEQQIIKRVEYIFKNLPDHKSIEEIDKSVFTPSFLTVLQKSNGYWDMLAAASEEDLSFESAFFWYQGNEIDPKGELLGMSVSKMENDTAYVKVVYKNYEAQEHNMKIVRVNGQWLCDEWDDKKEFLSKECERIENKYMAN